MSKDSDWRVDRPVCDDDRLECLHKLVPYYRNLWVDADFEDRHIEAMYFKAQYELYKERLDAGLAYEPKF